MQKLFLSLIILISITACSKKMKEKIGVATPGPDEYKVQRNKSLEVPPHYDLPIPGDRYESSYNTQAISTNLNEGEKELMRDIEGR